MSSLFKGSVSETSRFSDIIIETDTWGYARLNGTLASGNNLAAGAVLGVVTADGKYTELNPGGADGSEVARAILLEAVDASAGDQACVVAHGLCIAKEQNLVWNASVTDPQKATAKGQLFDNSQIRVRVAM